MHTLNSHNQQLLFHLSQLNPCRPTIRLRKTKNVRNSTTSVDEPEKVLCVGSLNETLVNLKASTNNQIFETTMEILLKAKVNTNFSKRKRNSFEEALKTSYIPGYSFTDNGREMLFKSITTTPNLSSLTTFDLNTLLCLSHFQPSLLQVRGFKTQRAVDAQQKRNPPFLSRFTDVFSISPAQKVDTSAAAGTTATNRLNKLIDRLKADGVDKNSDSVQQVKVAFAEGYFSAKSAEPVGSRVRTLLRAVHMIIIFAITIIIGFNVLNMTSSHGNSVFKLGFGNKTEIDPEDISVTFNDVKGCDEAKQELREIVEFLKNPDKFSTLGGKLPKGVLLVGPPGTGKTLLARAVAGEAAVPFFHAAGPEFDEVLVGQGARRVRDLFKAAKERAPCVIFIDEIDSVGAKRTNSSLHPYANQTINQLLTEMDGFHQNEGVIVLGATNRRNDLDQALLRPGRFDVEVMVPVPDYAGRHEIISFYLKSVLHTDIDVALLARGTKGFTGADLQNMINQAALRAAIDGAEEVSLKHLENARDKILMGPERKVRLPDEEANQITAYHEGGHAIVAYFTKYSHPIHKVTIMPRGQSLGHTAYIPEKESYHVTKAQLLALMDTMMGGRAAEELIFGTDKITSGASSDLKRATSIAQQMVKDWGMSEKVGLRTIEPPKEFGQGEYLGPTTNEQIDAEIKKILADSYERAKNVLKTHQKELKALAEALLKYETLDAEDIKAIMEKDSSL